MDETSAATAEFQSWKQPLMPGAWCTRVVSGEGGGKAGSLEGVLGVLSGRSRGAQRGL